jgi:hypothetical protein
MTNQSYTIGNSGLTEDAIIAVVVVCVIVVTTCICVISLHCTPITYSRVRTNSLLD